MDQMIEKLAGLQEILLKTQRLTPAKREEAEKVRTGIPTGMLEKFDRWVGRGKKAVAVVRHSVCSECHMQLPIGVVASLAKAEMMHTCNHCGRFLMASKEESAEAILPKTTTSRIHRRVENLAHTP